MSRLKRLTSIIWWLKNSAMRLKKLDHVLRNLKGHLFPCAINAEFEALAPEVAEIAVTLHTQEHSLVYLYILFHVYKN